MKAKLINIKDKIKELKTTYLEPFPGDMGNHGSDQFYNGKFYLLHDPGKVKNFVNEIIDLIIKNNLKVTKSFIKLKKTNCEIKDFIRIGMVTEDDIVREIFTRIYRINIKEGKEWGHPYYVIDATEEEKNKAFAINEREFLAKKEKEKINEVIKSGNKKNNLRL